MRRRLPVVWPWIIALAALESGKPPELRPLLQAKRRTARRPKNAR